LKSAHVVLVVIVVLVAITGALYIESLREPSYPTATTSTSTSTIIRTTNRSKTSTTTTIALPPAGQTITLIAKNIRFNGTNPTIVVVVGQPVTILVVNSDAVPHDFNIAGKAGSSTKLLNSGDRQTITVTFNETGIYYYFCSVHPGSMTGQIQVKSSA
jgi:plastocyanin